MRAMYNFEIGPHGFHSLCNDCKERGVSLYVNSVWIIVRSIDLDIELNPNVMPFPLLDSWAPNFLGD